MSLEQQNEMPSSDYGATDSPATDSPVPVAEMPAPVAEIPAPVAEMPAPVDEMPAAAVATEESNKSSSPVESLPGKKKSAERVRKTPNARAKKTRPK